MNTLRMFIIPNGTMKDQLKPMQKKVTIWTAYTRTCTISPTNALRFIFSTIMKSLECPICATTFTRKECNQLVKPIHNITFHKVCLYCTLPHDICYGAKDCTILNLYDLYVS